MYDAAHEDAATNPAEWVEELIRRRPGRERAGRSIFEPEDAPPMAEGASRAPILNAGNHKIVGWDMDGDKPDIASVKVLTKRFGARLRIFRKRAKLKVVALAARAGISHSNITHLEVGRCEPTLATAVALAAALGITLAQLVGTEDTTCD